MDKKQIAMFLKQVTGAFSNFEPTPERLDIWGRLLTQIDYETAIKRLDTYVAANRFPPTVADILNPDGVRKKKSSGDDYCEVTQSRYEIFDPDLN